MIRKDDGLDLLLNLYRLDLGDRSGLIRILAAASGLDAVIRIKPVVLLVAVLPSLLPFVFFPRFWEFSRLESNRFLEDVFRP
jgi:hypothetical protein